MTTETQQPSDIPEGFFFSVQADETGIRELKFRKDARKIFSVILETLDKINASFATPYPGVGDFCRVLGDAADQLEAAYAAASAPAANDPVTPGPEAA